MSWPFVSIIILNYNGLQYLEQCVRSVLAIDYPGFEVIVVDNASSDTSLQLLVPYGDRVRIIRNKRNLLSSGGLNTGIRQANGEVIVLLDLDTTVRTNWLRELVRPMLDDVSIAVTGSKLLFPDERTVQHAGGKLNWNGFTNHLGYGGLDSNEESIAIDVDYVCGASIAIRRRFLDQIGGQLDTYMPFYFEEVDMCWHALRLGHRVCYVPASVAIHHESAIMGRTSDRYLFNYHRGRWRFILKNFEMRVLLVEAIPAEFRWLRDANRKDARWPVMIRVYLSAVAAIPFAIYRRLRRRLP